MKHPILANWIRFKRIGEDEYIIKNLLWDEEYGSDAYTVWFAQQLDGKRDPYIIDKNKSKDDIDLILADLESQSIIRDKRFLSRDFLYLLITVWKPRVTPFLRLFSFFINAILLISWLPLFIYSVYYFNNSLNDFYTDYIMLGCIAGLLIGVLLHEFGHMFACLAYGGKVFELGLVFQSLLPGAYVLLSKNNIKKRMRKIQVNAAGIEMNILLSSIFLLLSAKFESLSGFFLGASIQNVLLALLNLTFVNGFDGMAIMGEILGYEDLVERAKKITRSRQRKKKLNSYGIQGKATVALCYTLRVIQIALPLIFALNIVGVISCFL